MSRDWAEWCREKREEERGPVSEPIYCGRCNEVRVRDEEEVCEECEKEIEQEERGE